MEFTLGQQCKKLKEMMMHLFFWMDNLVAAMILIGAVLPLFVLKTGGASP